MMTPSASNINFSSANTCDDDEKIELNLVYVGSEILVAILAVIGNALVIYVFKKERRLRRRTNYYIVSLATADLLVGLLGIPFAIMSAVGLPNNLHLCLFTVSLLVVLCTISIFCLLAVSVDRYWAILYPMAYSRNVRTKTAFGMSVFLICIGGGNLELVQLILEHLFVGGFPRKFLEMPISPISVAVLSSNPNIMKFLIEKKFTLDKATPETGITPLMFAAAMENKEAYDVLREHGANESLKNYLNHTSQDLLAIRSSMKFTELLSKLQEANTNTKPESTNLTLHDDKKRPKPSRTFSFIVMSPQGGEASIVQGPNMNYLLPNNRRFSNVSPFFIPNIASPIPNSPFINPISDNRGQQIFFPADFSSNTFYTTDFLNSRINNVSPSIIMSPNLISILSPRM